MPSPGVKPVYIINEKGDGGGMLKPKIYIYVFALLLIVLTCPAYAWAGQALDEGSSGRVIFLEVGESLDLSLESNASTGYSWQYFPDFTGKEVIAETMHQYVGAISLLPGAPGREQWSFKAVGAGTASISLGYMRPWESVQPEKIFKLDVIVIPQQITVMLNGKPLDTDVPPVIREDRTIVPLRAAAGALGAEVEWLPATRQVIVQKGDISLELTVGSSKALWRDPAGEHNIILDVPAEIIGDRVFVPLRFISEALGCKVEWDGETRTVNITSQIEV